MEKIRWGIIGCGTISRRFIDGMLKSSRGKAEVIYSRDIARAEAFKEEFSVAYATDDLDDIISNRRIDVAYIAANHPYHEKLTLKFLEAGIPVLCEKPIGVNAAQVKNMAACAKKNDTLLMEAIWTRYFPAYKQVREWIDGGEIGDIYAIDSQLGFKFTPPEYPRVFDVNEAGSTLLDLGVYQLNLMQFITGSSPETVNSACLIGKTGTDNTNCAVIRYKNGVVGTMMMSFEMDLSNDLTILGSKGKIVVPLQTQPKSVRLVTADTTVEKTYDFPGEGFQFEIDAFSEYVAGGVKESPVMPLCQSIEIAEIMDSMREKWGIKFSCE